MDWASNEVRSGDFAQRAMINVLPHERIRAAAGEVRRFHGILNNLAVVKKKNSKTKTI